MARNRNCMGLLLRVGVVICLAILIDALVSTGAAGFTVNSTADNEDMSCDPLPGDCTLREAIRAVNDGLGKKIDFNPAIFPPGVITPIVVGVELPAIIGSGTTVDGSGTGVVIDGSSLGSGEDGLVFESGTGAALAKVTIRSIVVRDFPGSGIYVCGGARPSCNAPLSLTKVSHVTATRNGYNGIWIAGRNNNRATVMDSYAMENNNYGIRINANWDLSKAWVNNCAAVFNGLNGIIVDSVDNNLNARLTSNTASRNFGYGIEAYAGNDMIRPKLTGNTSIGNSGLGIQVTSADNMVLPKLSENHATGNDSAGINCHSGDNFLGGQFKDNVATRNGGNGIYINGNTSLVKVKLQDNRSVDNNGIGIRLVGSSNQVKNNVASDNARSGILLSSPGQGNKVQGNRTRVNNIAGISVDSGSTNAQIIKNDARGNNTDLQDYNNGCDANTWRGNSFVTSNQSCIE